VDEPIRPGLFRQLLRRHAEGVVVVTAAGDPPAGFTATSFTSVSLQPPLVSFCVSVTASTWPVVHAARYVGVHVLSNHQEDVARRFATSGIDRFAAPTRWRAGPHGVPVIGGVAAVLVCRTVQRVPAGDHTLVIGEPVVGELMSEPGTSLVYHMGRYVRLADAG
jgi:flavin reductase (DIM6/NTAB) family NADH-FMN oxidoreductase RutF